MHYITVQSFVTLMTPASLLQAQADWLHRSIDATASAALAVYEFYARVTTASERPLYFVLLEVAPAKGARSAS